MKQVIEVKPMCDRKLEVSFEDGTSGVFDVTPYIRTEFFEPLMDESYFRKVRIFFGGVGWPGGQDLGPDTLAADLEPGS
jgi:hypothetical protein